MKRTPTPRAALAYAPNFTLNIRSGLVTLLSRHVISVVRAALVPPARKNAAFSQYFLALQRRENFTGTKITEFIEYFSRVYEKL